MELVANVFSQSIQRAIEEDGILSSQPGPDKLGNVYNMDQTAIFIDMGARQMVSEPPCFDAQDSDAHKY
ncbi:hypothetical protein PPTG_22562 [Phytophthora nicotianae INRA-310]|uniref:Uncharacterized protein n=1 Tax=Phytophthora nicotianae (strain INRA-310) TaxID=761204 RepID=W2QHP5_PHYN3|nr:hypothetical protein PPTG_22562 [Phytophthora nicotianae INRA-310]ETN12059.1 hypothetical protein PPTG_22562 [Phytophthora nicotianae INRA-310]